jgi:hypothetical protein
MPNPILSNSIRKAPAAPRKWRFYYSLVAGISLGTLSGVQVRADLNVVSESRSDSAATSGTYGTPDSASNSNAASGTFNDSQSAATSGMSAQPIFDNTYASDSASAQASQNTFISSGQVLQGAGSCGSSATLVPGSPSDSVDGNDSSSMSVSFTDSTAETLVLTGSLTETSAYHQGTLGVINDSVELSSSGDPSFFYQAVLGNDASPGSGSSRTVPFSFSGLLEPGQTYTLIVNTGTDSDVNDISLEDNSSGSFNFSASVPEPASLGILLTGGLLLLRPRRFSSVIAVRDPDADRSPCAPFGLCRANAPPCPDRPF